VWQHLSAISERRSFGKRVKWRWRRIESTKLGSSSTSAERISRADPLTRGVFCCMSARLCMRLEETDVPSRRKAMPEEEEAAD
jgi:hypothetical protein